MGDDDNSADDPDRAAILARRQRFIAIALSGLAATVTSCTTGGPQPCLDIAPADDGARPRPCLDVAPTPQPCLEVAPVGTNDGPTDDPADDGKAGDSETHPAETSDGDPVVRPTACLKVAAPPPTSDAGDDTGRPTPCLKVAPPTKPTPTPCLRVKRPD